MRWQTCTTRRPRSVGSPTPGTSSAPKRGAERAIVLWLALLALASGCSGERTPSRVLSVAFSPDGLSAVIGYKGPEGGGLYICARSGQVVRQVTTLTDVKVFDWDAVFSPDGKRVVFCSDRDSRTTGDMGNLYEISSQGTGLRKLTSGAAHDSSPVFSLDGNRIFFVRSGMYGSFSPIAQPHLHKQDIFCMNADGSDVRPITSERFYELSRPCPFPDGRRMLVRLVAPSEPGDPREQGLFVLDLSDPKRREFFQPDVSAFLPDLKKKPWATEPVSYERFYEPVMSPNGKWLAVVWPGHYDPSGYQLFLVDIESSKTTKLTDMKADLSPMCFTPDSGAVLFLATPQPNGDTTMHMVNIDGTGHHMISLDFSNMRPQ